MKKIHRFLTEYIPPDSTFTLSDERIVHQISRVLKIRPGETIALFTNGSDDTLAILELIEKKSIRLTKSGIREKLPSPLVSLTAAIAIPKGDLFELIVQKFTELGVRAIVPLHSARTVKGTVRLDRLQAISDEALEQCGGSVRVTIHSPLPLETCLQQFGGTSIIFDTSTTPSSAPTALNEATMYIGPEGGWSDEERSLFASYDAFYASLGPRVLRTETAAIVGAHTLLWK